MLKSVKLLVVSCLVIISLLTFTPNLFAVTETPEKDMLLTFDASGSMKDQFGGIPRIDALKSAVGSLLDSLDSSILVGLRPFAQVKKDTQTEACKETILAQGFTTERSIIKAQTTLLQAVGSYTPLAYTLTISGGDFKVGNDNVLVLLTDGKDTCGGDPVKAAGDLFNSAKKIKVYVIGIGVDSDTQKQLSAIAKAGGGVYYDASDSATLATSMKAIQNLEKPIDRTNTDALLGTEVRGGTGFDNAVLLVPGKYRLDHNLAPKQFDYFKLAVKKNIPVYFKINIGDKGVRYDTKTNSFTPVTSTDGGGSPWYDIQVFDSDRVSMVNMYSVGYFTKVEKTITPEVDGFIFFRVGYEDFETDKFSTFTISTDVQAVNGSTVTSSQNTTGSSVNNFDANGQTAGIGNKSGTGSNDGGVSNTMVYTLVGVIALLIIIVGVILFVLLKKKTVSVDNNSITPPNVPPMASI